MIGNVALLTPTWVGDQSNFEILKASIAKSPLADYAHYVVVQSEDMELFRSFADTTTELVASADILPREVERMRVRARHLQRLFGRAGTRVTSGITRRIGWPRWVTYTGWHAQQLTKLAFAARDDVNIVVAIDSDVVVTPYADITDFVDSQRVVCFTRPGQLPSSSPNKVRNWNRYAHLLFGETLPDSEPFETYFDTPFVFHTPTIRRMLAWLEAEYACPWWRVLLSQPPRRWSEFGSYRVFLRRSPPDCGVDWRDDRYMRLVASGKDPQGLTRQVADLLADPESHYITIHSQDSGHRAAETYAPYILALLAESSDTRTTEIRRDTPEGAEP